jgi:divalent metal cation (Fe/Co/Zn/Cd) transporter
MEVALIIISIMLFASVIINCVLIYTLFEIRKEQAQKLVDEYKKQSEEIDKNINSYSDEKLLEEFKKYKK